MKNGSALSRRSILQLATLSALGAVGAHAPAFADTWPSKPVKMVVAFPPGGPTDTVARLIAASLSTRLGQQVVVENRAGASGSVGTSSFIKSAADGYTISMFGMPALIAPIVFKNNLYDVRKDFTTVSTVYDLPYVLAVNPKTLPGVTNVAQLIALAKTKDLNYTTPGAGSIGHLSIEQLKDLGGFPMQHIAYKGSGPAIIDLVGGQLDVAYLDLIAVQPHIQSGKVLAIGLGAGNAKKFLPGVKSIAEQGFPGFESSSWAGLIVPNGTDAAIVKRLDAELKSILADKSIQEKIEAVGALPMYQDPGKMKDRLKAEFERWDKIAREKNISAS